MKPNAQPPRIQVALATGKLVLPEQGCLGQGGCEAKPDYEGVKPNAHDPVRNRITFKIRAMMARIFSYSGRHAKILLEFTDKEPFFAGLSVIKTHFTDKPSFFGDLSVNF